MRILTIAAVAALGAVLVLGNAPVLAQDIYGLSLRPTEGMNELSVRGSVDIVADGEDYLVSIDLSAAVDELDLDDIDDAEAFVVWVVDMDGNVTNAGALDENLVLEDAVVSGVVAKVFVTAEEDSAAAEPSGDRLYELTLRNVAETAQPTDDEAADQADDATDDDADEDAADEDADDDAATEDSEDEDSKDDDKPVELPTTGGDTRDLLVLVAVALGLMMGALRLRTLRV